MALSVEVYFQHKEEKKKEKKKKEEKRKERKATKKEKKERTEKRKRKEKMRYFTRLLITGRHLTLFIRLEREVAP